MEEIRLVLRRVSGDLERDEIVIGRQTLRAGRSNDNNLVLNNPDISRQHFRIKCTEDDRFVIEDTDSRNGIFLNDQRLPSRVDAEIKVGDVIRTGPYTFVVDRLEVVTLQSSLMTAGTSAAPTPRRILPPRTNGKIPTHIEGLSHEQSNWLQYLPSIFSDSAFDPLGFTGRYLLIFEDMLSPLIWMIDGFDQYLSPEIAPTVWLQWIASWFDLLLRPELPEDRQRQIVEQMGWLFLRRGTPSGLRRLLELYFGVVPEIIERELCQFEVVLPLASSEIGIWRTDPQNATEIAKRLIESQKPAFASFVLRTEA